VSLALGGKRRVVARGRKLLKVSFKLTDGGGRVQDMGGDGLDVSSGVTIWLVP
jgi:hypothetical protein